MNDDGKYEGEDVPDELVQILAALVHQSGGRLLIGMDVLNVVTEFDGDVGLTFGFGMDTGNEPYLVLELTTVQEFDERKTEIVGQMDLNDVLNEVTDG